jgi:sugar O-acyltransferase (sialic acid O-acetyltransferase NeuD family)
MRPLVFIGGGGHCKVCMDVATMTGMFRLAGIVDPALPRGWALTGVPVLGDEGVLPDLIREGASFLVAIGQIRDAAPRRRLYETVKELGGELATVISPRGVVAPGVRLGAGTLVAHGAIVGPDAVVGENVIVNTMALVEHDAVIGSHCHLATGCRVNGGCQVGTGSFVGSGAVVVQGVRLGDSVVLGAGATAVRDLLNAGIYVGAPARRIA